MSTDASGLHVTRLGESGPPVIFCHGLFGQGKNWTQFGKALAGRYRCLLVDMPNHGRSAWTSTFSYSGMADAVAGLIDPAEPAAVVGHSMGGKAAMLLALRHPELVERLCVVDVSPVAYNGHRVGGLAGYAEALLALDLETLSSRAVAEEALREAVPETSVRSFLLQNLRRDGDGWRWQPNLRLLRDSMPALSGWDDVDMAPYDGPVLWVAGQESDYIKPEYDAAMSALFPKERLVTIKGAGHWVHSQQPAVFGQVLEQFLARDR